MQRIFKIRNHARSLIVLNLSILLVMFSGCSKKSEKLEPVIESDIYSYEVTCTSCEIQFMDINKSTKRVVHSNGKWAYSFDKANPSDLKITVKTNNKTYQSINVYILKNDEVIYGELGYNNFELFYNIKSGDKSMVFGSYSSNSGGAGAGGTPKPVSTTCGAKNKTGGYCKRKVSGGGRCWQHS